MQYAIIDAGRIVSAHATHPAARAKASRQGLDKVRVVDDDAKAGMHWRDHWFEPVVELRQKRRRAVLRSLAARMKAAARARPA